MGVVAFVTIQHERIFSSQNDALSICVHCLEVAQSVSLTYADHVASEMAVRDLARQVRAEVSSRAFLP